MGDAGGCWLHLPRDLRQHRHHPTDAIRGHLVPCRCLPSSRQLQPVLDRYSLAGFHECQASRLHTSRHLLGSPDMPKRDSLPLLQSQQAPCWAYLVSVRTLILSFHSCTDAYSLFFIELLLFNFVELRRFQDYRKPGSMGKQYLLGLENGLKGSGDPAYPGAPMLRIYPAAQLPIQCSCQMQSQCVLAECCPGRSASVASVRPNGADGQVHMRRRPLQPPRLRQVPQQHAGAEDQGDQERQVSCLPSSISCYLQLLSHAEHSHACMNLWGLPARTVGRQLRP